MERRSFMLGLFAFSAGAAGVALSSQAEATSTAGTEAAPIPGAGSLPTKNGTTTLPEGLPAEFAQYYRRGRRRRQVCTFRRNRWGRRVRVCRTVWY